MAPQAEYKSLLTLPVYPVHGCLVQLHVLHAGSFVRVVKCKGDGLVHRGTDGSEHPLSQHGSVIFVHPIFCHPSFASRPVIADQYPVKMYVMIMSVALYVEHLLKDTAPDLHSSSKHSSICADS